MDVLSEVLRVVKLEGALFFNAEFSAPWCLRSSGAAGIAPYLSPVPRHLIMYHFLTEGRAYAMPTSWATVLQRGRWIPFGPLQRI